MKTYFYNYIKRRPFMKKWPPYYDKLKELLARKMACGNYTVLINKALDEDSAWNKGVVEDDAEDDIEDIEDLNLPRGIVK